MDNALSGHSMAKSNIIAMKPTMCMSSQITFFTDITSFTLKDSMAERLICLLHLIHIGVISIPEILILSIGPVIITSSKSYF